MEPLCNLSKCPEININRCILLKTKSQKRPLACTWRTRFYTRESLQWRKHVRQIDDVISRLDKVMDSNFTTRINKWHKQCYSHFTQKARNEQVAKRLNKRTEAKKKATHSDQGEHFSGNIGKEKNLQRSLEAINSDNQSYPKI